MAFIVSAIRRVRNQHNRSKNNYSFTARFNYNKFVEKFCNNDIVVAKQITGSTPPSNNDFWIKMKQDGWDVITYERKQDYNGGTKEKSVDTSIVAYATDAIISHKPDLLILLSGDLDMKPIVHIAKKYSCDVNLWTYKESSSYGLEEVCDAVFYLNDHKHDLVFFQVAPGVSESYIDYKEQEVSDEWEAHIERKIQEERKAYEEKLLLEKQKALREKEAHEKQLAHEKRIQRWKTAGEWLGTAAVTGIAIFFGLKGIKKK